jgi:hypothetical protein
VFFFVYYNIHDYLQFQNTSEFIIGSKSQSFNYRFKEHRFSCESLFQTVTKPNVNACDIELFELTFYIYQVLQMYKIVFQHYYCKQTIATACDNALHKI